MTKAPQTITAAEYQAGATKKAGTKRVAGVEPVVVDGIRFHSKREAWRYGELILLERAGDITDLERQVKYPLKGSDGPIKTPTGRPAHYVADFRYKDMRLGGIWVVEDAKGYQTEISKLKIAILAAQGQKVELV